MDYRMKLDRIKPEIDNALINIETYASCIASLYEVSLYENLNYEEDFIAEMHNKQAELLYIVNNINDIAMHAMAVNDKGIVMECEDIKAKVVNVMERVRNLYM